MRVSSKMADGRWKMGVVNSDFGMRNSETKLAVDGGLRSVVVSALSAISYLLYPDRRSNLSLTDCVSFAFLEEEGIREAIVFDRHFTERGIRLPQGR